MTDAAPRPGRLRRRLAWALSIVTLILAIAIVPPLVNVSRYKAGITRLIAASLHRPVRLSSVEMRLLPRPGFVITDLTVAEDPVYGAEPLLHASTVTASIRVESFWRGLEIGTISVDDASLNLVRTPEGRWNVESLFRSASQADTAAVRNGSRREMPLPYLEATNSRINVKSGVEKLPYSLVDAEVSLAQDGVGEWRIRLRGQPARTDLSLDLADTGLLRVDASFHRAPDLRQLPMQIDAEWSEAQLGQLTRLLIGSDPGWRGDMTGDMHMEGTPETAKIAVRLRAIGVHRAEFAPAASMDFDANCAFVYHRSTRAAEGLECSSPVGDGRVRLMGSLPGGNASPKVAVELDRLPVAFCLDALRTLRSGIAPGLEAGGTISGKISYAEGDAPALPLPPKTARSRAGKARSAPQQGPLFGSLSVQGFELRSPEMNQPIRFAKVILEPAAAGSEPSQGQFRGLLGSASIPAGSPAPLVIAVRLGLSGYTMTVHGQSSLPWLRELASMVGLGNSAPLNSLGLDSLTADTAALDLSSEGPWLAAETIPSGFLPLGAAKPSGSDMLTAAVSVHNASWKAPFLANPIELAQATLHVDGGQLLWDPVEFKYGAVKGTGSLTVPLHCDVPQGCAPQFQLGFGDLDAGELEAAILGARKPGTLLTDLIARISPSRTPVWPSLKGTVRADSLVLGPVKLQQPVAELHIADKGAEVTSFDASLFGGQVHSTGKLVTTGSANSKPAYSMAGQFQHLNPSLAGKLVGLRLTGGEIEGSGKVDLSGFTTEDLAASAAGTLHFDWRHGSVAPDPASAAIDDSGDAGEPRVPAALARFDTWSADATIAHGEIQLGQSEVQRGARKYTVVARLTLAKPPQLDFTPDKSPAKPAESAHK